MTLEEFWDEQKRKVDIFLYSVFYGDGNTNNKYKD